MAEIRIKRVYEAPATDDGFRVLVDRLWPRGISKEHAALGAWWKDIAPSPELRKWFGHKAENFAAFTEKYRAELEASAELPARIEEIAAHLAAGENVTLLYGAKDPEMNQARVLCDWLHTVSNKTAK